MKDAKRLIVYKRVFLILLALGLFSQLALAWAQRHELASGYFDFVLYYSGAQIINEGRRHDLYKLEVQRAYQKDFGVGLQKIDVPFNHAPYQLLIFLPLAHFSYPVAHFIWSSLNALLLLLVVRRLAIFIDSEHKFLYVLMAFAYFPSVLALKMGHDSILSTFLMVEAFISLWRRRDATAGCLFALGLYKPQLVLPMVGILIGWRRWRAIATFALAAAVLVAVSLAMVGLSGAVELVSLWVSMTDRGHLVRPEDMINLRGLFYVILDSIGLSTATNLLTLVGSVTLYAFTMILCRGPFGVNRSLSDLKFSLSIVTTVLISFHLYSYDASLLLIPLIVFFEHVLSAKTQVPITREIFLLIFFAFYIPLLPNVLWRNHLLAWETLPVVILYTVIALEIRNQKRESDHSITA